MKTRSIARGIVGSVAALLGVMAAGCSADVSDPQSGEAEIGSTSQAIVKGDVTAGTAFPITIENASSCIVENAGTKYMVVAGGLIDNSGSGYSTGAYLLDGTTWRGPFAFDTNLSGSEKGAMIARPGHADQCLYVAGENSGTAQTGIQLLTFATVGGNPGLTVSNAGVLNTARSRHQLAPCGNSSVAILGGNAGINSIELWSGQTGTTAIAKLRNNANSADVTLNAARTDFALVALDSSHFAVAAGQNSGGTYLSSVESFNVQNDATLGCKLNDGSNANAHYTLTPTITARHSLKGYLSSSTANDATFVFVAGEESGPVASKARSTVKVNWTTPASSALVSQANDLATGTIGPVLVKVPTGNPFVFGGSVADYQENDGTPWSTTVLRTNNSSIPVRTGAVAEFVGTTIKVVGGFDGTNYLSSMDLVTP